MERDNRKDKFRKALNVVLAIAVFGAWGQMVFSGEGTLADLGLSGLTAVSLGLGWLFRKVRFCR